MRYFVTGATGFIGGRVARQLVEAGHEVIALARSPKKAQELADAGIQLAEGDVTDKATLRAPMTGVDGVFHIAGWYKIGVKDKSPGVKINIDGTRNVLETMRELGIPKGVYTSTLAINSDTHGQIVNETYRFSGQHISEYDRTKWVAHYEVAEPMVRDGLPLVTVMPGGVYGPGDSSALHGLFTQYLQRKLPVVPRGAGICWGYIDDTVRGHLLAMEKGQPGETYIISGPPHTYAEALALAEKITGVPPPRLQATPGMLKMSAAMMGAIEKVIPVPDSYSGEYLRVSAGITYWGDNGKAKRELGFNPRPLAEGLPETLKWEMAQLGMK